MAHALPCLLCYATLCRACAIRAPEYNLLVFDADAGSHGWIWEYYAPLSCHLIHGGGHGQKRPGLIANATYIGRTALDNGVHAEVRAAQQCQASKGALPLWGVCALAVQLHTCLGACVVCRSIACVGERVACVLCA